MKNLKATFSYIFLLITILIINVIQTLIYPFKIILPKTVRGINRFFARTWWSLGYFSLKYIHHMKVNYYENVPEKENAIVICNHQGMADIPILFGLAYKKKRLGDLKWIVKDALKKIPGIGWGMVYLDCIFVKRNWFADKDKIFSAFSRFEKLNIPIWLVSFPEGTRRTEKKQASAKEFARRKGYPEFDKVLIPRTKGFAASLQGLRNHIDAIYDVTIKYPIDDHTVWGLAVKLNGKPVDVHVTRIPITEMPTDDQEIHKWLINRFQIKNDLLSKSTHANSLFK